MMSKADITAGFIPLVDAAILVAAFENGHAAAEGLALRLVRETSWANVRDRLAVGQFQAAHALAPMPIAANLGLTPFDDAMIAPMALGLGGNAVTISRPLWDEIGAGEAGPEGLHPAEAGGLLRKVVEERRSANQSQIRFGVVHPHSSHNLELRYWLSACSISPDSDIEILILPPTVMADALAGGRIDGYCVGEPWNSVAVAEGSGRVLTTKNAIWASSPEKVLALPAELAEREPDLLSALLRALHASAQWCADPQNRTELARMLSGHAYLAIAPELVQQALGGPAQYEPFARAATFPWQSHALWFYSQMVRWGFATHSTEHAKVAMETYRPDLYRNALSKTGVAVPAANAKVEGALSKPTAVGAGKNPLVLGPDGFFDARIFDPDRLEDYLAQQRP